MPALMIILICLMLLAALIQQSRVNRLRRDVADDLRRLVNTGEEMTWMLENRERLAEWQELSEQSLDEGTATVRTIHHAIAGIPFSILEAIPATRDTTRMVRGVHDVTANGIYAGISIANRLLGRHLRESLESKPAAADKTVEQQSGDQHLPADSDDSSQ